MGYITEYWDIRQLAFGKPKKFSGILDESTLDSTVVYDYLSMQSTSSYNYLSNGMQSRDLIVEYKHKECVFKSGKNILRLGIHDEFITYNGDELAFKRGDIKELCLGSVIKTPSGYDFIFAAPKFGVSVDSSLRITRIYGLPFSYLKSEYRNLYYNVQDFWKSDDIYYLQERYTLINGTYKHIDDSEVIGVLDNKDMNSEVFKYRDLAKLMSSGFVFAELSKAPFGVVDKLSFKKKQYNLGYVFKKGANCLDVSLVRDTIMINDSSVCSGRYRVDLVMIYPLEDYVVLIFKTDANVFGVFADKESLGVSYITGINDMSKVCGKYRGIVNKSNLLF